MLINNTQNATFYQYVDIQFVAGYWYAWYYKDVGLDDIKVISELDNSDAQKGSVNG
jgi:hypothetical protein